MSSNPIRPRSPWALTTLLALGLVLVAGCSSKTGKTHYAARTIGSNCFAKAVPTTGEGGLAWGDTLSIARKKSLDNCVRYASRSGGLTENLPGGDGQVQELNVYKQELK